MTSLACKKLGGPATRRSERQVTACSGQEKTAASQGLYGVGLAVEESLCRTSVYTHQFVDERLMSMQFDSKCEAVNFFVVYAPTDCTQDAELYQGRRTQTYFLAEAGGLGGKDPDERESLCTDGYQRANWTEDGRMR